MLSSFWGVKQGPAISDVTGLGFAPAHWDGAHPQDLGLGLELEDQAMLSEKHPFLYNLLLSHRDCGWGGSSCVSIQGR